MKGGPSLPFAMQCSKQRDHVTPFVAKTHMGEELHQKGPRNIVKSSSNVQLEQQSLVLVLLEATDCVFDEEEVFMDASRLDEGAL